MEWELKGENGMRQIGKIEKCKDLIVIKWQKKSPSNKNKKNNPPKQKTNNGTTRAATNNKTKRTVRSRKRNNGKKTNEW